MNRKKRPGKATLEEQVIPIHFPRLRVVAIENTICLSSAILASFLTLGMLESIQVTVVVEFDRGHVARC